MREVHFICANTIATNVIIYTWYSETFIGLPKERPMVIDSLNLNLSQISSFMHIYRFADFNRFVDLWILVEFWI